MIVPGGMQGASMKWSKLKQRIEVGFADAVKGRVEVWSTRYRKAHDEFGEGWITVDGEKVHGIGSTRFLIDYWQESEQLSNQEGLSSLEAWGEAKRHLHAEGNMALWAFNAALFDYLSLPFDRILASEVALIRALGMLDRRLGKRRLAHMDTSAEPDLVRRLHRFRCECEGLRPAEGV